MKSVFLCIICLFLLSCGSTKYALNEKKTNKIIDDFLKTNKNAFACGTNYATFSFIWTYKENEIEIVFLVNGKVKNTVIKNLSQKWITEIIDEQLLLSDEVEKCFELSGDYIEYKLFINDNLFEDILPININCFKRNIFENKFFSNLSQDMNTYCIWGDSRNTTNLELSQ